MHKINVIGTSGSGKSWFSQRLAMTLKYPYIEMDKIFWGPDWYWPSDEEFFKKLEDALQLEAWVLDGNYTRTNPIKWRNVDTVIWIDYSFSRTLLQAVKRAFIRAWTKQELWEGTGNRESFRKSFFSKDSIILWTSNNYFKVRKKVVGYMNDPALSHIKFIRLRSPYESASFLNNLGPPD